MFLNRRAENGQHSGLNNLLMKKINNIPIGFLIIVKNSANLEIELHDFPDILHL